MGNTVSRLTTSTAPASPPIRHQQLLVTPPISLPKTSQIAFKQNPNPHRATAAPRKRRGPDKRPIGPPANALGSWSEAEELELIRLHESGKTWEYIASKLPGRTAYGCRKYYWRRLAEGPPRRTKWSEAEDLKMVILHESGKPWDYVASKLPGRTVKSCISHYRNHVVDKIDKEKRNGLASLYERYGFKSLSTLLTR